MKLQGRYWHVGGAVDVMCLSWFAVNVNGDDEVGLAKVRSDLRSVQVTRKWSAHVCSLRINKCGVKGNLGS